MLLIGLRPKQAEQGVTSVEPTGAGHGQIGKQGGPLRLGEDGVDGLSIGAA
jgi:hypothetical protein